MMNVLVTSHQDLTTQMIDTPPETVLTRSSLPVLLRPSKFSPTRAYIYASASPSPISLRPLRTPNLTPPSPGQLSTFEKILLLTNTFHESSGPSRQTYPDYILNQPDANNPSIPHNSTFGPWVNRHPPGNTLHLHPGGDLACSKRPFI